MLHNHSIAHLFAHLLAASLVHLPICRKVSLPLQPPPRLCPSSGRKLGAPAHQQESLLALAIASTPLPILNAKTKHLLATGLDPVPWRYERHALPLRHVGRVGVFIPTFYSSHTFKLNQSHYFSISLTLKHSIARWRLSVGSTYFALWQLL